MEIPSNINGIDLKVLQTVKNNPKLRIICEVKETQIKISVLPRFLHKFGICYII